MPIAMAITGAIICGVVWLFYLGVEKLIAPRFEYYDECRKICEPYYVISSGPREEDCLCDITKTYGGPNGKR